MLRADAFKILESKFEQYGIKPNDEQPQALEPRLLNPEVWQIMLEITRGGVRNCISELLSPKPERSIGYPLHTGSTHVAWMFLFGSPDAPYAYAKLTRAIQESPYLN